MLAYSGKALGKEKRLLLPRLIFNSNFREALNCLCNILWQRDSRPTYTKIVISRSAAFIFRCEDEV